MRTTAFWLLVAILPIGSWSLQNDMNEYAFELPVPTEGISAQDIYHEKGAAPEKMNEVGESPTTKSKQEYDHYDDCDLYFDDETTTCSYQRKCGQPRLDVYKRGAVAPEDAYDEAEEHDYITDVATPSPSP